MPFLSLQLIYLEGVIELYEASFSMWGLPKKEPTIIMLEDDSPAAMAA